jgi:hypothetical protein
MIRAALAGEGEGGEGGGVRKRWLYATFCVKRILCVFLKLLYPFSRGQKRLKPDPAHTSLSIFPRYLNVQQYEITNRIQNFDRHARN